MININDFIEGFSNQFPDENHDQPWIITNGLKGIIEKLILHLDDNYHIGNNIAIHKTAIVESGVVIKSPAIVMANCFVGTNAYFRDGVFLDNSVRIGPGCEIKNSMIFTGTAVAHFNYIGNSIIGRNVNFEAGSIAANHYNERADKKISVLYRSQIIETNVEKFGSLVGDNSKIGANAVLSPGTILRKNSVVRRLELIEQIRYEQDTL